MKTGLVSKSVSVGKGSSMCWPGAQSVAKEQQVETTNKTENKATKQVKSLSKDQNFVNE